MKDLPKPDVTVEPCHIEFTRVVEDGDAAFALWCEEAALEARKREPDSYWLELDGFAIEFELLSLPGPHSKGELRVKHVWLPCERNLAIISDDDVELMFLGRAGA